MIAWKDFIFREVIEYCDSRGSRTFRMQDFLKDCRASLRNFAPDYKDIDAKVRQQFQFLRDDNLLTFMDNRGTYTLRGVELLKGEREAIQDADIPTSDAGENSIADSPIVLSEKREYFVETYVRDIGWASAAKDLFGTRCLAKDCNNYFKKPDGMFYIEVHHIVPLCDGGDDGIENLSVLCAHHHRMAHFAESSKKDEIRDFLLDRNERMRKEGSYESV